MSEEQINVDLESLINIIEESIEPVKINDLLNSYKEKHDNSSLTEDVVVSLKTASYVDYDK